MGKVKVTVLNDDDKVDMNEKRNEILAKLEDVLDIPQEEKNEEEPEEGSSVDVDDTEDFVSLDDLSESLSTEDEEDEEAEEELIESEDDKGKKTKEKYKVKRKERNEAKKKNGVRRGKQSKYSTRSYSFLKDNHDAIHLVMCSDSEIYRDGADICPRILLGKAAFNKPSKKNAFIRLKEAQETFIENMGGKNPEWIIISQDTTMIVDRHIVSRLKSLRETTHVAGTYGVNTIRQSGKWWTPETNHEIRGTYMQGSMTDIHWSYRVGAELTKADRHPIVIAYGPYIAVRYELFMEMDFTYMADNVKDGFQHFMAHISLEAYTRGKMVAALNTPCIQYDSLENHLNDENFSLDHMVFLNQWKQHLPTRIQMRR